MEELFSWNSIIIKFINNKHFRVIVLFEYYKAIILFGTSKKKILSKLPLRHFQNKSKFVGNCYRQKLLATKSVNTL